MLTLWDNVGGSTASLASAENGPTLSLSRRDGRPGIALGLDKYPGLKLFNNEAKGLHAFFGMIDESPVLQLNDRASQGRVALGIRNDGTGNIRLMDANGQRRVLLGTEPDGRPRLAFADGTERVRTELFFAPMMEGQPFDWQMQPASVAPW